jgi:hypothetical protein
MRPSRKELMRVAQSHFLASFGETLEASVALAWYGRNLVERAHFSPELVYNEILELAPAPTVARFKLLDRIAQPGLGRSARLVRAVWDDRHADPTAGAVRAHRHKESPRWAELAWPTALIGPWIFYKAGG